MSSATLLGPRFFRHAYAKLVASLTRRLGDSQLALAEDAAQSALEKALHAWPSEGEPDRPEAWLFRVAYNEAVSELRKMANRARLLQRESVSAPAAVESSPRFEREVDDDLLRMLFVACDPELPSDSQLALTLKVLCGFSVGEIAERLFTSEANVYKRVARARARLRATPDLAELDPAQVEERRPAVQAVIYLLFTEGHLSSHAEFSVRRELCDEAVRLGQLLARKPLSASPESDALVALMLLHRARLDARMDEQGSLRLLEEQDRAHWDRDDIGEGMKWLVRSARGDAWSRYHAEARIAAAHCLAPSFEATSWDEIERAYALLEQVSPSPLHRLNRAVALAQWKGPAAGLELLEGFEPPTWIEGSYLWAAALAELHGKAGNLERAEGHRARALEAAPSEAIRRSLARRLGESS